MTIDRTALRRLWLAGSWKVSGHAGTILDAVPSLLDALDEKDRRIAELEMHPCNEQRAKLVDEVATLNATIRDLDRKIAELERPRSCPVCGTCETHDVPKRIVELERTVESGNEAFRTVRIEYRRQLDGLKAALREALEHWRYPQQTAEEKARKDEIWALAHGKTKLLPSEET